MIEDLHILPIVFRLMQGETLPIDECQHVFFKRAIDEGVLVENRNDRTIKAKKSKEERYHYARERYGNTLLNYTCRFFDDHENDLLMKYWGMLHGIDFSKRGDDPDIPLNEKDEKSITLCGKVKYIQHATKGTSLTVVTKVNYTKLNGVFRENSIYTTCIIPGKEYQTVKEEISENSNILIKGCFRPEKGKYQFFYDELVNVIVEEYVKLDNDEDLKPENGDENFFIDRSEPDSGRCLNKVILTGKISNIGFGVTRGYPHLTLHLRTKSDEKKEYLEIPVEIWEKHHKDCLKDINIGDSIWIEGYFKHPLFQKNYYSYEPVDATVFAYKYKILSPHSA